MNNTACVLGDVLVCPQFVGPQLLVPQIVGPELLVQLVGLQLVGLQLLNPPLVGQEPDRLHWLTTAQRHFTLPLPQRLLFCTDSVG